MLSKVTTIIVLTRDRLIRADFAGAHAGEPTTLAVRERPHVDDQATLVEMALAAERRKPGRVFVLSCDVWTHTLAVGAASTHGMSPAELLQSLAFEAEPLSGLSAFEVMTAAAPLGDTAGQRNFWVSQIGTAVRDQIQESIRTAGGRLAGILHPGGVPQALGSASPALLTGRVEFWPGATTRMVCQEGIVTRARIDDSSTAANWLAAVESWRKESGAAETVALVSDGELPADAAADECVTLADEAALRAWLGAWHQTLVRKERGVPVVAPSVQPMSNRRRLSIAALLASAALGACWGHAQWVTTQLTATAEEKTRLEAPGLAAASIRQEFSAVEKDRKKIREEYDKLQLEVRQAEEVFDSHRRRLAELMRRLADDSSHDWVLQKIDGTGREIKLTGTTMHPEHISLLAEGMSTDLARLGWTVDPPKQRARNLRADGGPWTFELRLHDLKSLQPPVSTTPAANLIPGTLVGSGMP